MKLGQVGNAAFLFSLAYPQIKGDMDDARREKRSVVWAGAKSAVKNNWLQLIMIGANRSNLQFFGWSLLLAAPALVGVGANATRARNDAIRMSHTPFSQMWEHTDWTWREQQRGMSSITGNRSFIGSEAGGFARRYGRR